MTKATVWYELQGGYYIPCLILPAKKKTSLSAYGGSGTNAIYRNTRRHFTPFYLQAANFNGYLADIEEQTQDMMFSFS